MVELIARTPAADLLPVAVRAATLSEAAPAPLTSLQPYRGRAAALSEALHAAHGLTFPEPNRVTGHGAARCIWFGRASALLAGVAPDPSLAAEAALTDQSDAWGILRLEGTAAPQVLARLTPVDLRARAFAPGATARTELAHMAASLTRLDAERFEIMVMRSMTAWAVHEIGTAMHRVAGRG